MLELKRRTDTIALRKYMAENKIFTITQLSKVSGVNRNTLSKVLKGSRQPSAAAMLRLKHALKIPQEKAGVIFFNDKLT